MSFLSRFTPLIQFASTPTGVLGCLPLSTAIPQSRFPIDTRLERLPMSAFPLNPLNNGTFVARPLLHHSQRRTFSANPLSSEKQEESKSTGSSGSQTHGDQNIHAGTVKKLLALGGLALTATTFLYRQELWSFVNTGSIYQTREGDIIIHPPTPTPPSEPVKKNG